MVADPKFDAFYNSYVAATSVDAMKTILQQANDYIARQHLVVAFVESSSYQLIQPWFKGYNGQTGAISGTGTGPSTGFYLARYWIDPTLKK
jgi:ABC-type oligopeptide transport system substrate-binding subunit